MGLDLLFKHFSLALERTIRVVQAKLEEAKLEVPFSLWDVVRDDVSSPDPFNLLVRTSAGLLFRSFPCLFGAYSPYGPRLTSGPLSQRRISAAYV
ncbi:hypothetical protein LIER_24022 [Lithospermum erythrorhizon]|uniref:Uncharacterized protein n=1 Tax=Lithospermum erythrorhizon TaxID=34254 RepID=A0AAV3R1V1_LITER